MRNDQQDISPSRTRTCHSINIYVNVIKIKPNAVGISRKVKKTIAKKHIAFYHISYMLMDKNHRLPSFKNAAFEADRDS